MAKPTSTSNNPVWSTALAAASTASLAFIYYTASQSCDPDRSNCDDDNNVPSTRLHKVLRTSRKSLQDDYPLWIGSFWLVVKQQQLQPNVSIWQILSDTLFLGALLTYKKTSTTDATTSSKDEQAQEPKSNEKDDTTEPNTRRELFQDQATPKHALQQVESTVSTDTEATATKEPPPQRYLEVLVHNISHTDVVLSLDAPMVSSPSNSDPPTQYDSYCMCRPRFSAFDGYSQCIWDSLAEKNNQFLQSSLISFPRYERSDATNRYHIKPEPTKMEKLPIGFALDTRNPNLQVSPDQLTDLRVRGRDGPRVVGLAQTTSLNAIFFPLLAMLLPQWNQKIQEKYASSQQQQQPQQQRQPKKVLILVSGVGTPRNWTHSMMGNSTQQCAKVMQRFVQTLYPDWVVVQIHSETNIFRYDENIAFVQNEFMPCIQSWRDAHAKGLPYPDEVSSSSGGGGGGGGNDATDHPFSTEWRKSLNVTLSFADGSPARNHAIQAALRPYRPTYFHCWQLKTFWHESKIVDSDIEVHSFEEMETLPPIETSSQKLKGRPLVLQVVEEMKAFRNEMQNILKGSNDLRSFWLRKTHKPVLAVLAVQVHDDGPVKLYRGTNMEVSMPTGSLCAERNVIGTALADNPALERHHLKLIAVLSVPPPNHSSKEISRTSSVASLVELSLNTASTTSTDHSHHHNITEPPSWKPRSRPMVGRGSRSNSIEEEWVLQDVSMTQQQQQPPSLAMIPSTDSSVLATPPTMAIDTSNLPSVLALEPAAASPLTPARRINLYSSRKQNRKTVVVHSQEDLNPLMPCGACNEWLKKIAEPNPYFQIVTFTDADCNGVYCTPCEE
jgi:cytidine deaminase